MYEGRCTCHALSLLHYDVDVFVHLSSAAAAAAVVGCDDKDVLPAPNVEAGSVCVGEEEDPSVDRWHRHKHSTEDDGADGAGGGA